MKNEINHEGRHISLLFTDETPDEFFYVKPFIKTNL